MPLSPTKPAESEVDARCFGLRIESHVLQVAIATRLPDGRHGLEIDEIECSSPAGWLTAAGSQQFLDALEMLVERHDMRRQKVVVSLDGDFCVTRVTMGTTEEVDAELRMLADRVPRYLQLGPGEKVTGASRKRIAPTVDYAVTGVINRSLIQLIYDALRETDIDAAWVEPSIGQYLATGRASRDWWGSTDHDRRWHRQAVGCGNCLFGSSTARLSARLRNQRRGFSRMRSMGISRD